jgi:hypothetical protein
MSGLAELPEKADRMGPAEAGRFLGLAKYKLRYYADAGKIPCFVDVFGFRVFSRRVLEELKPRLAEIVPPPREPDA